MTTTTNPAPMREMLSALLALITCEHRRTDESDYAEHCLDCGARSETDNTLEPADIKPTPGWKRPPLVEALAKCRAVLRRTIHAYNFAHFSRDPISVEALRDPSPLERRRYFEPFEPGPVELPPLCTSTRLFRGETVRCALAGHPKSPTHHHPWCGDWRDEDLDDGAPASGAQLVEIETEPPPPPPIGDAIAAADRAWFEKVVERNAALMRRKIPDDAMVITADDVGDASTVLNDTNDRPFPFPGKKDQ